MISIKMCSNVYGKKKGTSTDIRAYSPVTDNVRVTVTVAIDGQEDRDRQSAYEKAVIEAIYKIHPIISRVGI
ncbi:hypothetical protein AP064_05830 [Candidatus Liberibacter solanacearum]|uniref:Uncharacterized protein n=2 Tax=Candidatus Liberibacter solanacearum TaxID=556287 RepID=A0A0F4VLM2_9HYPH|nr:hypothetical protein [Candidatus Liberibacter solanacearum]KJZ81607.1 hypothetical protein DJ66_0329 [Candidatus Liberibacter solanacearum]KQC48638.1 hypothetical protein AP064_05830 [Candidatus Liberibacter solanacearum]